MSTRITNSMVSRNVLADLNATYERLDRTRMKASSGKEINRPSDNPYGTARALAMRESLDGTRQHQRNIQDAAGWQASTEQALARMTEVVQRARDLTIQGATDTSGPTARTAIAAELDQLVEELKEHGNATYAGRYVFGGTETTRPPTHWPGRRVRRRRGDDRARSGPGSRSRSTSRASASSGRAAPTASSSASCAASRRTCAPATRRRCGRSTSARWRPTSTR